MGATLNLLAPLRGWAASLDETPDAAFAQRLLGDGVAIDPTGNTLHAPCDGEVISIAASTHAVAIRAGNGAEVLLHVGIDTVALRGDGFRVLVEQGARVRSGDPLLAFDLDVLARRAKSLITPIVITNGDRFAIIRSHCDRSVDVGDTLIELQEVDAGLVAGADAMASEATETFVVALQHGIHARPAALIANFAKGVRAEIVLSAHGRKANARSAVALMSLGVRNGDELTLSAVGEDAARAVSDLRQLILGIVEAPQPQPAGGMQATQPQQACMSQGNRLRGVIASNGIAVGCAVRLKVTEVEVIESGRGIVRERAEFERGRAEVRARLEQLMRSSQAVASEVIAAHLAFLDDCELVAAARRAISSGKSAAFAWRRAIRESADALRALGDQRMAERIDDLLDVELQVLLALNGETPVIVRNLPERAILLADDLKPSQLAALDAGKLAGICMAGGGSTSHVAILAAAMGVPALVALGPAVLDVEEGAWLVLDAEEGTLTISPDQNALAAAEQRLTLHQQRKQAEVAAAQADCRTADGVRIEVFANLGSLAEARIAVAQGAEGCGLLRTEFLFLDRDSAPTEDEQVQQYQSIAQAFGDRPLVVRTADIGGDKPIPYLPLPSEANPALGLRGVRTSLRHPDLLRAQLRAILRVQPAGQCRVLLPMITDPAEIEAVRRMLDEARRELARAAPVSVGAMIETPASAVIAERIARNVDFISIGTNDLTQYTLAMDRCHSELAHRIDGLHPAVLRLMAMTVEAADKHSRPVAVCGGLASEPAALPVLIGLGVRELSVVPTLVPQIKSLIRALTLDACRSLSMQALELDTADAVRALVKDFLASESQVAA